MFSLFFNIKKIWSHFDEADEYNKDLYLIHYYPVIVMVYKICLVSFVEYLRTAIFNTTSLKPIQTDFIDMSDCQKL